MSYIKFSPSILIDNDEIDESVLWKSGYKVYELSLVDNEILKFLDKRIDLAYPLFYWEDCIDSWPQLIMHKNFPFKKSFCIYNNKGREVFTLTLSALDIRTENKSFDQALKHAAKYLFLMGYDPNGGSVHPEKFYNRLKLLMDHYEPEAEKDFNLRVFLGKAEELCKECIKYESFLNWESIENA
jgi:hypothetical protein